MARGRGRFKETSGAGTSGVRYTRDEPSDLTAPVKMIRKADGSLVEARRTLTPEEVKARDKKAITDFLEKRDELVARGVLPSDC